MEITYRKLLATFLTAWMALSCMVYRPILIFYECSGLISSRQFESHILLNIPKILMLMFFLLVLPRILDQSAKIKKSNWYRDYTTLFFVFLIISFFLPIKENWESAFTGVVSIIYYLASYFVITRAADLETFERCMERAFAIITIMEFIIGFLYYLDVIIPFLTLIPTGIERNSFVRMQGTLNHPGEFSLYIGLMFSYFACKWFYEGKKTAIILSLMNYVCIYFSGSRATLVAVTIILFIILLIKYRKNMVIKILFVFLAILGALQFLYSGIFIELFVENSFEEIFLARLIHWIIAFRIMTADPLNFIFGIGLNNNVDYIYNHYTELTYGLPVNIFLTEEFAMDNPIHNSYLICGVETGIIGIILFIAAIAKPMIGAYKMAKKKSNKEAAGLYFIFFSLVFFAIYALQGWGTLKENALMIFMTITAYYRLIYLKNNSVKDSAVRQENYRQSDLRNMETRQ